MRDRDTPSVRHGNQIPRGDLEGFLTGEWHVPWPGEKNNGRLRVVVPGWMLDAGDNRQLCARLVDEGYTVVAVNGFDHGLAENSIEAQARELGDFLKYEGMMGQECGLDAHSMGGAVALRTIADQARAGEEIPVTDVTLHAPAGLDSRGHPEHLVGMALEAIATLKRNPVDAAQYAVNGLKGMQRHNSLRTIRQAIDVGGHDALGDLVTCLEAGLPVRVILYDNDQVFNQEAVIRNLQPLRQQWPELLTIEVINGGHNDVNSHDASKHLDHRPAAA